ncbi:hypothetical protein ISN45_At01g026800 [Arabidopsis thaliana x Arabidopsis arenosa]|uniref:Uncharacterized protein n=1 Tax=Arabidopsis thaliana x Arabidopsis arenosa TaxID=1240361 RepID=A0A8T2GJX5_9BRAS|nr:hypothetical protein ISN45_At01g026800 [Arabidopsis thaliana x Arabidopsis arenosa]
MKVKALQEIITYKRCYGLGGGDVLEDDRWSDWLRVVIEVFLLLPYTQIGVKGKSKLEYEF